VFTQLANLLRESQDVRSLGVWENERPPTPVVVFGVRLHSMGVISRFDYSQSHRPNQALANRTSVKELLISTVPRNLSYQLLHIVISDIH